MFIKVTFTLNGVKKHGVITTDCPHPVLLMGTGKDLSSLKQLISPSEAMDVKITAEPDANVTPENFLVLLGAANAGYKIQVGAVEICKTTK